MLAERGDNPFNSPDYLWEQKYDGTRCLAYIQDGRVRLVGRRGSEYNPIFPELLDLPRQINAEVAVSAHGSPSAVLDGEVLCFGPDGLPDFQRLQQRLQRSRPLAIRMGAQQMPVTYVIFDLLAINGRDLTAQGLRMPLGSRRALLERVVEECREVRVVESTPDGIGLFERAMALGLEGVMGKERQGLYYPGKRHRTWLKVKGIQEDTFLVGGYTAGEGWRTGLLGALLLGKPDGQGLRYCGSVGTGFTVEGLEAFLRLTRDIHTNRCPFLEEPYEPKLMSYLEPRLLVDIKFHEKTPDGKLRFPVFMRVRTDLAPEDL